MSENLKNKVEAVLFASGKSVDIEEIAKLCRHYNLDEVKKALNELKDDYEKRGTALMVVDDGNKWKLTVREAHMNIAKRIVADTELTRSVIETLAVVAWKQPIKQSEVIKIRTNKAYDHIKELEEMGFLTRKRHGRTKLIKLTEKFFKYFELSGDKDIREVFKGIKEEAVSPQKKVAEFVDEEEKLGNLDVYEEKEGAVKEEKKVSESNIPSISSQSSDKPAAEEVSEEKSEEEEQKEEGAAEEKEEVEEPAEEEEKKQEESAEEVSEEVSEETEASEEKEETSEETTEEPSEEKDVSEEEEPEEEKKEEESSEEEKEAEEVSESKIPSISSQSSDKPEEEKTPE